MSGFISREADYAIRIVAYLAGKKGKTKISEICEKLYLTKPIVIKIIHKLNKCNIVETLTGKNGGVTLIKDISELSIYEILTCIGLNSSFNICVDKPEICKLNPICNITTFFKTIQDNIIHNLKSAKIKDFIFDDDQLNIIKLNNR
ncbi:Rrf2 family transcriptional regulator [Deferribacter autotrophicus]|uniref:Rrf2 family transcriptional regulator n=1 Tax=Deferribacter autotrophicus TaxID=500465 RepID=A0A5A8F1B7_9BACT|nr:Rrf2 family transcriptional regulator [Deferribacter autotrophicus]KAA0257136.1 Rrf2 family transcriptional regulator [Deferribacter autotrophicus]